MAVTHNANIREYTDYLRTHPGEVKELVRAFLINVTGFFRDPEAFEFIRSSIVPELVNRARTTGRILRLWSAGCATGEEAYSLALLIADSLGPELSEWSVKIFATDLAEDAINFARRGLYPDTVLNNLPLEYRERFFEPVDHGYRISKKIRQVVIFGQQDISRGVPFPRIDLVACRNLLIYLKPDLQQVVLDLFAYSLQQSRGYLFLGKSETARPTKAAFELVNKRWKIYRSLGGTLDFNIQELSAAQKNNALTREGQRPPVVLPGLSGQSDTIQADVECPQLLRRIDETLLRHTNVAIVIIDAMYRMVMINTAARRLLGVRDIAYDQDFLHSVRGLPYQEVRRAIDVAFREQSTVTVTDLELDQAAEGTGHYINLTIMIMQVEQGAPKLAVITALDTTEQVQIKRKLEAVQVEQVELVGELSTSNRRLSAMNKELQDANEELQATNEELMMTQEELQATNEEFEATNEELQATNEELETNNEELQAMNEELQTTNDELTARTLELQEIMKRYRIEQVQLEQLLERFPHYVLILNAEDLTIEGVNPTYRRILGSRDVIGLPVSEVFSGQDLDKLLKVLITAVRERQTIKTTPLEATVGNNGDGSDRMVHTAVPILDDAGDGVARLFVYSEKPE